MTSDSWDWKNWQTSQSDPAWNEARKGCLTASVVAEFYGIGYRAWKDLYEGAPDFSANSDIVQRGKDCEPLAATDFAETLRTMYKDEKWILGQPGILKRQATFKGQKVRLGASLDRVVLRVPGGCRGSETNLEWYNLEIKVPNKFHGLPQFVNDIKPRYLLQIIVQMWVTKLKTTFLYFWREDSNVCFRIDWTDACDQIILEIFSLVPRWEDYYFYKKVSGSRPRCNPFKEYYPAVSKLLDKLEITLAWSLIKETTNGQRDSQWVLHEVQGEHAI